MPVTIAERVTGRRIGGREAEREYIIRGATSESDALNSFTADTTEVPSSVGSFTRSNVDFSVEELAEGLFIGTAKWINPTYETPPGTFSISIDISGETTHITQSLETVSMDSKTSAQLTAAGVTEYADDLATWYGFMEFGGTIGVSADGSIGGVDIVTPKFVMNFDFVMDPSVMTNAYIGTLARSVGKVNSATFRGLNAGEALLVRASGSRQDDEKWNLQLGFAISENLVDEPLNGFTEVTKDGWDYIWYYYDEVKDTASNMVKKIPVKYFVERVYRRMDFATLSLPE